MADSFVINIIHFNLSSIFNILNAITTKYQFLANENTKFWKMNLVTFLKFFKDFDHLNLIFL